MANPIWDRLSVGNRKPTISGPRIPIICGFRFPYLSLVGVNRQEFGVSKRDADGFVPCGRGPRWSDVYRILGYVPIDDVVGITAMTSSTTNKNYANFTEFCNDGGVEMLATEQGIWDEAWRSGNVPRILRRMLNERSIY